MIKTIVRTVLIFWLIQIVGQSTAQAQFHAPISKEDLQADISAAYEFLQRFHPNLYAHKNRQTLERIYRELVNTVPEKSNRDEALAAIMELVGAVCDEHTYVLVDKTGNGYIPNGWPWFEFPLIVYNGKLFVEEPGGDKHEVVSINDVKGIAIAHGVARRAPNDGCLDDRPLFVNEDLRIYGRVIRSMIGRHGPYVVRTRQDGSASENTRTVAASDFHISSIHKRRYWHYSNSGTGAYLKEEGFDRAKFGKLLRMANLDYRYSPKWDVAYLKIKSFVRAKQAKEGVDLVMRDIIARNPEALVIDLAGNPGGRTRTSQLLLAYLLPSAHRLHTQKIMKDVSRRLPENFEFVDEDAKDWRQHNLKFFRRINPKRGLRVEPTPKRSFGKPDYKGRIIVLVSPDSRSNSTRFAITLKRLRNAKIVGFPSATDTTTFCAGANGTFKLKNTGFLVYVPDVCFRHSIVRFNDDKSLDPDIVVSPIDWKLADLNKVLIREALISLGN